MGEKTSLAPRSTLTLLGILLPTNIKFGILNSIFFQNLDKIKAKTVYFNKVNCGVSL